MPEVFVHRGVQIQRHGSRWRWRLRDRGPQTWHSFSTIGEAVDSLDVALETRERRRSELQRGEKRVAISSLCAEWFLEKQTRIAPGTAQQYEIHIRKHIGSGIGDRDANEIRPRDLESFYASLRWKSAKESHNILRQAFGWGLRNELLSRPSNPCLVVRPSRRACVDHDGFYDASDRLGTIDEKAIPNAVDIEKLLVDAKAESDTAWWLYLRLATATGARPGEICALRRRDFDSEGSAVRIEWSADRVSGRLKRPKTPWSIRTLFLGGEFFDAIIDLLPEDQEAFLFPSNGNRGMRSPLPCWNPRTVKRQFDGALGRTGVKRFTAHALRHYAATHLLDLGFPPLQVARFLGHANDQLVRTLYANHIVDESQRAIGEAASRLI